MKNTYLITFTSITIFSLFFCSKTLSKQVDTLIFNSTYEKITFLNFVNNPRVEPINLLLSINNANKPESIIESLNDFLKSLEKSGIRNFTEKKKIKEISKKVNSTFLKKYTSTVLFSDIFTNGNYNCITASALYALVFDYFNVNYSIKKKPQDVYLIADPNGEQVVIESDNPSKNFTVNDEQYKKSYVDYLRERRLISEDEYKSYTISDLFDKTYNQTISISLYQLAAIQYYNSGVLSAMSSDFQESLKYLEKAELLSHDYSIGFLKNNVLINILSYQNNTKKYSGTTLAKYVNTNPNVSSSLDYATNYFKVVTNELVISHPIINSYTKFYSEFLSTISDSVNKNDFSQNYYDALGFYYYTSANYPKSLFYFANSYKLNNENIAVKQAILELIGKSYNNPANMEDAIDSVELHVQKFPFLLENANFQQMLIASYMSTLIVYFEKGNFTKGRQILSRFEKCVRDNKLTDSYPDKVSNIYWQLSSYFYRTHYYENQEEILRRGLEILPNSKELQASLKSFESSKAELMEYARKNHYPTKDKPYSMDSESIKVIKEVASKNRNNINLNVEKFLKGRKWRLESIAIGDRIIQLEKKEQVIFTFENENIVTIKDNSGESTGIWSYNKNESTIKFYDNKDKETTNVLIYDLDDTTLKAIMYNDNDPKKIISILKSI